MPAANDQQGSGSVRRKRFGLFWPGQITAFQVVDLLEAQAGHPLGCFTTAFARAAVDHNGLAFVERLLELLGEIVIVEVDIYGAFDMAIRKLLRRAHIHQLNAGACHEFGLESIYGQHFVYGRGAYGRYGSRIS